ncbi:MAG: ADP-ribosyltransferase [Pseudomonadota bacterium]
MTITSKSPGGVDQTTPTPAPSDQNTVQPSTSFQPVQVAETNLRDIDNGDGSAGVSGISNLPEPAAGKSHGQDIVQARGFSAVDPSVQKPSVKSTELGSPDNPASSADLKWLGDKRGSSQGGIYSKPGADGQTKLLVKEYGDADEEIDGKDQAYSELAASRIYAAAGVNVPKMGIVDGLLEDQNEEYESDIGVTSEWIDGVKRFDPKNKEQLAAVQKDFALHALLANWDAIGEDYDNIVYNPSTDSMVMVDPGGSLDFRAMGGRKDDLFGPVVREIDTMRGKDPSVKADQAADVFGKMSDAEVVESMKRAEAAALDGDKLSDAMKEAIRSSHPAGSKEAERLIDIMEARALNLREQRIALEKTLPTETPAETQSPASRYRAAGEAFLAKTEPQIAALQKALANGSLDGDQETRGKVSEVLDGLVKVRAFVAKDMAGDLSDITSAAKLGNRMGVFEDLFEDDLEEAHDELFDTWLAEHSDDEALLDALTEIRGVLDAAEEMVETAEDPNIPLPVVRTPAAEAFAKLYQSESAMFMVATEKSATEANAIVDRADFSAPDDVAEDIDELITDLQDLRSFVQSAASGLLDHITDDDDHETEIDYIRGCIEDLTVSEARLMASVETADPTHDNVDDLIALARCAAETRAAAESMLETLDVSPSANTAVVETASVDMPEPASQEEVRAKWIAEQRQAYKSDPLVQKWNDCDEKPFSSKSPKSDASAILRNAELVDFMMERGISLVEGIAIRAYTHDFYEPINNQLRGALKGEPMTDVVKDLHANLLNGIAKLPPYDSPILWRQMEELPDDIDQQLQQGQIFPAGGIYSTQKMEPTEEEGFGDRYTLKIELKASESKGRDISMFSKRPEEAEVIFPNGTQFYVSKREDIVNEDGEVTSMLTTVEQ